MSWYPSRRGGSTWSWGPLWWNRNYIHYVFEPERPTPRTTRWPEVGGWKHQPRLSKSWVQETEEPWRAGIGLTVKFGNHTYNIGAWRKRPSPVEEYQQLISELAVTTLEGD